MMKNRLKKLLLLPLAFALCFAIPGCGENTEKSSLQPPQESQKKAEGSPSYFFASKLGMSGSELENLLKTEQNSRQYRLVPASSSKIDRDFWTGLVTTDEEYMQTYFLDRKVMERKAAIFEFNEMMRSMWGEPPADTLLFVATLDASRCGIISCHDLSRGDDVTISYVTAKEYKNQKVATNSLKMVLGLLRYLSEKGFYSVKTASVWIFDDNEPSIQVAKSNGFSYAESDSRNKRARYSLEL